MAKRRRERIFLIPRMAGLVLAALVLLIFALGYISPGSRSIIQTLGITLMVAGVVALIQTNENLRGIEIVGCSSAPAPAGGVIVLEIVLRNGSDREHIGLQIRPGIRWRRWLRERPPPGAALPLIKPGETATVRISLPAAVRGRFAVPEIWVSSVMPVGLGFAWKAFPDCGEYFVYPAPTGMPLQEHAPGAVQAGILTGSGCEDVTGHRPYESGDALSRMDWRVFARTGKLMTRMLEDGSSGEVLLRWADTHFLDDDETRLEQLSRWVSDAMRARLAFTLDLGPSHGVLNDRNPAACQRALATFGKDRPA